MRQFAAVATAVTVLLTADAPAPAAELEFVAPDKLAATVGEKSSVWVRNTGSSAKAAFELETEKSATLTVSGAKGTMVDVPGRDVTRFQIAVGKEDKGELVVRAEGFEPGSLELTASKKPVIDIGVTWVLVIATLTALVAMGRQRRKKHGVGMGDFLPEANYDFKASFASTITAGGAILATVISAGVLPQQTVSFSKAGYTALSLVFAIAVAVAPLVYSASERRFRDEKDGKTVRRGQVWAFLVAAGIVVWATFGQLWTLAMLADELTAAQGFSDALTVTLWLLLLIAAVTVLVATGRIQWALTQAVAKAEPEKAAADRPASTAEPGRATPKPSYTLLEGPPFRRTSVGDTSYDPVKMEGQRTSTGDDPIAYL